LIVFSLAKESSSALSNRYELNLTQNEPSSSLSPIKQKIIQFEEDDD